MEIKHIPAAWQIHALRDKDKNFIGLLIGGAEEDRTPDLRIANATLSQLSYRPNRAEL